MMTPDSLSAHYADYYTNRASEWRDIAARAKANNVIALWEAAGFARPGTVIEMGCGDGAVLARLDQLGFAERYIGIELSASALTAARSRRFSAPVEWRHVDDAASATERAGADLVVLSHVVEHAGDPRGMIAQAVRAGRAIVVEVPLEHHWRTPKHWRWTDLGHINLYTPSSLRWLVESAIAPRHLTILGERVVTVGREVFVFQHGTIGGTIRWLVKKGLLALAPWLATRLFTYHGAVLAKDEAAEAVA